jgi:phosphoribosylformimino-5-aminoimidazole carboxamide ribotide isomerase
VQIAVMRIIGVIDLEGGRAVHARGGRRSEYQPVRSRLLADGAAGDAAALAAAYRREGVAEIYVADLDAIGGGPEARMSPLVSAMAAEWVDAGVRDGAGAEFVVAAGTPRIVLALETLASWTLVDEVKATAGAGRTAFGLDLAGGEPLGVLGRDPVGLAVQAVEHGASAVIVLDLRRVGEGAGLDRVLLGAIRRAVPGVDLVVGGGVRGWGDVTLAADEGYDGVLVGTALHTGAISLLERPIGGL